MLPGNVSYMFDILKWNYIIPSFFLHYLQYKSFDKKGKNYWRGCRKTRLFYQQISWFKSFIKQNLMKFWLFSLSFLILTYSCGKWLKTILHTEILIFMYGVSKKNDKSLDVISNFQQNYHNLLTILLSL